ncbi:MAG: hypothetical protein RR389_08295 [Christensenella sp.]
MMIEDAPYIKNYMLTGEENPRFCGERLEEIDERLTALMDERREVEEFVWIDADIRDDVLNDYDTQIRGCERIMEYYESGGWR